MNLYKVKYGRWQRKYGIVESENYVVAEQISDVERDNPRILGVQLIEEQIKVITKDETK